MVLVDFSKREDKKEHCSHKICSKYKLWRVEIKNVILD